MEAEDKAWPMTEPFEQSLKGQVSYASMIGSIFLHFIVGSDTHMNMGWDRWKATYYMVANSAGLTEIESEKFLNQTCLILVALGILDLPEGVELDGNLVYAIPSDPDKTMH